MRIKNEDTYVRLFVLTFTAFTEVKKMGGKVQKKLLILAAFSI